MNATITGVRCANHNERTYHTSAAEVRNCFRNSGKGSQRIENLDDILDAAFDVQIQERERQEDEAVARAKMDCDIAAIGAPVTEDGMYRNPQTGEIFKVYRTVHGANQLVAKRLMMLDDSYSKTVRGKQVEVKAEFVYAGKAGLRGLTAEMKMTLEEGKKYGAIYGVCVRCAATLTREESIERAMGPVCAGKANWA